MSAVEVVGGVYGERCAFPFWDEVYGSGGRAAAGLSSHVDCVRLHTVLPPEEKDAVRARLGGFGVEVAAREGGQLIGFDYLHCLSDPVVTPRVSDIRRQASLHVKAEVALLFGMMECTANVDADVCVYDPQSPTKPIGFRESGSKAKRLAFIANAHEISRLTRKTGPEAAREVLARERAEVVVVKRGIGGAFVVDRNGEESTITAYTTKRVFTIGSGDIFAAAFALAWGIEEKPSDAAADYASRAASNYVETSVLPMQSPSDVATETRHAAEVNQQRVYLAGPFRDIGQRATVNEARRILRDLGMTVFSPVHDIGHGPPHRVVKQDLEALQNADVVVAILNGNSPGTIFEVGYAAALGKPVFCIAQNVSRNDLKLPIGTKCSIHEDFVTGLHAVALRT